LSSSCWVSMTPGPSSLDSLFLRISRMHVDLESKVEIIPWYQALMP
jgi:hypothetical protein